MAKLYCSFFHNMNHITGVFSHILVFVEMFVMHILHLYIDGDLMYFMTNVFDTKDKFLLPLFF